MKQTDYLIVVKCPDFVIIKKKKRICRVMDFAVPASHSLKIKESEKRDKYLDLVRELRKLRNMRVTVIPIITGALGTVNKCLEKRTEGVLNQPTNRDHLDYSIVEIGQNIEKCPEEICCLQNIYIPKIINYVILTLHVTTKSLNICWFQTIIDIWILNISWI